MVGKSHDDYKDVVLTCQNVAYVSVNCFIGPARQNDIANNLYLSTKPQ